MNFGRKLRRQTGGASIAEYALLIGLLGTTALVAISQVGGTAGNGIEHAGQVIAENAGSKKGHPGQGNPGNGNPGNGNPGNGNPGNGDPGEGGSQPTPVTTVAPDQGFDFDGYVGPGETVGKVVTEGEPPKGFELVSGGAGLQIDDSGSITIVDPEAFGPVETTKPVTVRIIPVSGPAAEGVIEVKRSTPVDLANDATTKGRLIIGTPKKSDFGTGDTGDWIAFETDIVGHLHVMVRGDAHSGTAMTWPFVTLRNESGASMATEAGQLSSQTALLYNDLPAGKYFIQVSKNGSLTGLGGYVVSTEFVDDVPQTRARAQEIAFGSTVTSTILYGDNSDMWKVEVPHKTHVRFMTDSQYGDRDGGYAHLEVYDAGGKLLGSDLGNASNPFAAVLLNDLEAGTYYLKTSNGMGRYYFDYGLSVTEHTDDARSNIQTEAEVKLTQLLTGDGINVRPKPTQGSMIIGDPSDWYRLEVDERTDVQVLIDRTAGSDIPFTTTLRNNTGGKISSKLRDMWLATYVSQDAGNRYIFQDLAPGTYYIEVAKYSASTRAENEYSISAEKIIDAPDTRAGAGYYPHGSIWGSIDYGENSDYYRFTAGLTGTYRLRLHNLGIGGGTAQVYDASGKAVGRSASISTPTTVNVVAGEDYFVQVVGGMTARGEYGFSFAPDAPTWLNSFPEFPVAPERSGFQ